jgi:PPOX class probable FMN-dependent enzyme
MSDRDPHSIQTVEQLRAIIGEPSPVTPLKVDVALNEYARAFIARAPFLVLSTSDAAGKQDVSPKGDTPGFVAIEDDRTLLIPDRKGNKLIFSLQNILANPRIGMLFIIPGVRETFRVNGSAELTGDPAILERLSARGQPALLAIRVTVEECFFHCAKAFIRSQLWQPASWPAVDRISFGKMFAAKLGADDQVAQQIDQLVEDDYKTGL